MTLVQHANGRLGADQCPRCAIFLPRLLFWMRLRGFRREGETISSPDHVLLPNFVRPGLSLEAGWDIWSGYYLASCDDVGDEFLRESFAARSASSHPRPRRGGGKGAAITNDYPHLTQLLGSYFHQDFAEEFASVEDAVQAFAEREPSGAAFWAAEEIGTLIRDQRFQQSPEKVLIALGCYYDPRSEGSSALECLRRIQRILSARRG